MIFDLWGISAQIRFAFSNACIPCMRRGPLEVSPCTITALAFDAKVVKWAVFGRRTVKVVDDGVMCTISPVSFISGVV